MGQLRYLSGIAVFIVSIFHLGFYKKKNFAVVALAVSTIVILLTVYGLFYNANLKMTDLYTSTQISNMQNYCSSSCENVPFAVEYLFYYNFTSEQVYCECINGKNETLTTSVIPEETVQSQTPIIKISSSTSSTYPSYP